MPLSEGIIIAIVGLLGSILAAVFASRAQARTTAAGLYAELCKAQQTRIGQLMEQMHNNEQEIERLRTIVTSATARITELESRNRQLETDLTAAQSRIESLESENENLRQTLKSMQSTRRKRQSTLGPVPAA